MLRFRHGQLPQVLFKHRAIPALLEDRGEASVSRATIWRARNLLKRLEMSGGPKGDIILNTFDRRLDCLYSSSMIPQLALLVQEAGPLPLRRMPHLLGYASMRMTRTALRRLLAAKIVERKKLGFTINPDCSWKQTNPIENIPQREHRQTFLYFRKALRDAIGEDSLTILYGDYATGRAGKDSIARVLLFSKDAHHFDLLTRNVVGPVQEVASAFKLNVEPTIAFETHLHLLLWNGLESPVPHPLVRSLTGIAMLGKKPRRNFREFFQATQRAYPYPSEKLKELLESQTLEYTDGGLSFTSVGVKRYCRAKTKLSERSANLHGVRTSVIFPTQPRRMSN